MTMGMNPSLVHVLKVIGAIIGWWIPSVLLTMFNKLILDNYGFKFPLMVTSMHFFFSSVLLMITFAVAKQFLGVPKVTRQQYFKSIVPIAFFSATDIALGNVAYALIPLSLLVVLKSFSLVAVYLVALIFRVEVFRTSVFLTAVFITISIGSALYFKSGHHADLHNFHWAGVFCIMIAVFSSAFRWVIVQTQVQNFQPLQLMLLTQPLCTLLLGPVAFLIEFPRFNSDFGRLYHSPHLKEVLVLIAVSVPMAYCLLLGEYSLVKLTSSMTICVVGVAKEIVTILLSIILFKEWLTSGQIVGVVASIIGILVYTRLRTTDMEEDAQSKIILDDFVNEDPEPQKLGRTVEVTFGLSDTEEATSPI